MSVGANGRSSHWRWDHVSYSWNMARLKLNITVEEFCQHRKKKNSWPWLSCQPLLKIRASHCWTIVPVTVEESCQPLLNNCTSDCSTIMPVTVEQLCQRLLNNRASDCWTIMPATNEDSFQWLLNNCASDC